MQAHYLPQADTDKLLDPEGAAWSGARTERVKLEGTPATMQPTELIRAAWADKPIGAVTGVQVAAPRCWPSGWSGKTRRRTPC
jgi:hypothetical protein